MTQDELQALAIGVGVHLTLEFVGWAWRFFFMVANAPQLR